jgi:hypothetical protein
VTVNPGLPESLATPARGRLGFEFIVELVVRSRVAWAALGIALALAAAELAVPAVRNEVTKEFPFAMSILAGVLLLVLTVAIAEAYVAALQRRHEDQAREQEEKAWRPSANRIRDELGEAINGSWWTVHNARQALFMAEQEDAAPDRESIASPVDEAAQRVAHALDRFLPVLLQRADLRDAAGRGEQVLKELRLVAHMFRDEAVESDNVLLTAIPDGLQEHEAWFTDAANEAFSAEIQETIAQMTDAPGSPGQT